MNRISAIGRWNLVAASSICLLLTSSSALATAQQGDVLILDGKELWTQTNPLEPFLRSNPDKRPQSNVTSTGLWRGYVATWEVHEQGLYLTDVEVLRSKAHVEDFETEFYSAMSKVFPGEQRVLATWFTGHIVVPRGKLVEYVHLGYASTYKRYTILTIQRGLVTNRRDMKLKEFLAFRQSQFRTYQETEEYKKHFEQLKDPDESDEKVESFIFEAASSRYLSRIESSSRSTPESEHTSDQSMTHAELATAIKIHLRSAFPKIQVRVEPWHEDTSRTAIYFIEEAFSDLYPWQRFHYLMHSLPDNFVKAHLSETIWFELAPGERPEDLLYVDEEMIEGITLDVMETLESLGFFTALDDAMAPKEDTLEPESCQGDFRITKRILAAKGLQETEELDEVAGACHVLMKQGAFCDCEVLFNVYEGSRLGTGTWQELSEELVEP